LPLGSEWERGFAGEVTRLNGDRQFKPFIYLNFGVAGGHLRHGPAVTDKEPPNKKNPAFRRDFPALA
jgi:hypothetical protein